MTKEELNYEESVKQSIAEEVLCKLRYDMDDIDGMDDEINIPIQIEIILATIRYVKGLQCREERFTTMDYIDILTKICKQNLEDKKPLRII
jgi:hypothetical protein